MGIARSLVHKVIPSADVYQAHVVHGPSAMGSSRCSCGDWFLPDDWRLDDVTSTCNLARIPAWFSSVEKKRTCPAVPDQ